jgi:Carbohydrate esterase, sialic acid-specific acetylesterase
LIDGVRRDLDQPDLPIVRLQTGRFAYPYNQGTGDWESIREAQRQAALERQHVYLVSSIDLFLEDDLGDHLKTGHRLSLQNRPTGLAEDVIVLPCLSVFGQGVV